MNKKILIAGLLVSVLLLVPINSAYSNNGLSVKNDDENLLNNTMLDDTWIINLDCSFFDTGNSVIQVTDGGFLVMIERVPLSGWTGVDLYKISSNGDIIWENIYGNLYEYTSGFSLIEIPNNKYVMTGWINDNVWLAKIDYGGDRIWQKAYGINSYAEGTEVIQTFDGGFAIVGCAYYDYNRENSVVFLLKTNDDGNETWVKTFDNELYNFGCSLKQTSDGGYIIVGYSLNSYNGRDKLYLLKTDENGTLLWEKTYGGKGYGKGLSLQVTNDSGYIITGCTRLNLVEDYDIWLLKTDRNGTLLWEKTFGGKYEDIGYSVQITDDGGYILAGSSYISLFNCDVILIKTDNLGNKEWSKTTGGANKDFAKSVRQTTDGGFILTGSYKPSLNIETDAFLIKTDANGTAPPLSKTKDIEFRNRIFEDSFLTLLLEKLFDIWRLNLV